MSLGIYISVPFCRSKCTYCNFASGVFSPAQMGRYTQRLCADMAASRADAAPWRAVPSGPVDTIYLGGGTPSLLSAQDLREIFSTLAGTFDCAPRMEVTVECAPGTLTDAVLEALVDRGVNRVSLGVQSFVDREAAAVARLHTCKTALEDIERLRRAGIHNINVDLIAGLPHQTAQSWEESLRQAISTGVPHVSVYMLEVDGDSRLGRELIAGGARYHAPTVPDDDAIAGFYETACSRLEEAGLEQYEISNFARAGFASRHNLKYWSRQPYFGFGVDAHSMLPAAPLDVRGNDVRGNDVCGNDVCGNIDGPGQDAGSVRLATTDSLEEYLESPKIGATRVSPEEALEESFFLGLRLNRGIHLDDLRREFGARVELYEPRIGELLAQGLLRRREQALQLTQRGRLLSNEVFERFIQVAPFIREPADAGTAA